MKKTIICAAIVLANLYNAQANDSQKNIPQIIPPSPTVNSLMKFEEVPVSNYTGIPDITIPVANVPVGLSNVDINLALKYHVNNAASESKASEVGLGWSLFAGGTISRTVMGSPDEKVVAYSIGTNTKLGIYWDENTNVNASKNYFSAMIENPNQAALISNAMKSVFEAHYKNRYDTQYDLYQYNFLNYTGRFIVKKVNGILQVMKLDKNNLKITVNATQDFEPTSFDIIDEFGNKFIFDVLETSSTSSVTESAGLESYLYTSSSVMTGTFNSAFHLSKIKSSADEVKVSLKYDEQPVTIQSAENTINNNFIDYQPDLALTEIVNQNKGLLPKISETSTNITVTQTRKIREIEITGKGKIIFEYENGREDTNYVGGDNATRLSKLKNIIIQGIDGKYDEKYSFNYTYKENGPYKRLFLSSVQKLNKNNGSYVQDFNYQLDYYNHTLSTPLISGKEIFFKCPGNSPVGCSNIELLKSVTHPTKGKSEFIYETGTFSFVPEINSTAPSTGAVELTNFDENPLNWDATNQTTAINNFTGGEKYVFTIPENNTPVTIFLETASINQYAWTLKLLKKEGSTYVEKGALGTALLSQGEPVPTEYSKTLEAGEYYLKLVSNQQGTSGLTFNTSYNSSFKVRNTNNLKYLFDYRNVRIKNINYYIEQGHSTPNRTINFNYNTLSDNKKSTGALVFPTPLYSYSSQYEAGMEYVCSAHSTILCTSIFIAGMIYNSDRNFLPTQKTKGSDIGYQFVTVSESGRGKTIYQYTSPIDQPNPYTIPTVAPFKPVANYDYTRGNLLNKKIYDNSSTLLTEDRYIYTYDGYDVTTGAIVQPIPHPAVGMYLHGGRYVNYEDFVAGTDGIRPFVGNDPFAFLSLIFQTERIGTAHLTEEKHIEYFPNQHSLTQITNNTYNTRDYITKKTVQSPDNTISETTYKYAHEKGNQRLINANMIAVPLEVSSVEKATSSDPGNIVSKSETKYDDVSHLFPSSVVSYKLSNGNADTEVTFDKYDNKGNILQYTSKGSVPVAVVWGYNGTQPIAKVEGITYDQLVSLGLVSTIVSASDADAVNPTNEPALLTALDNFRNNSSLSGYLITTITYDQLLGITHLTPPSGIREKYIYSANKLEKIVDEQGKVLKEFQYNYKN
ncbi:hypothetical protein ATE47_12465 [Chryseobacterium sp. IHB B 17019]|uniref:hypothetical protein n=1 Tax=Chryseobacterium sp. IHB B 17019 TaxID=1721091 RepID=UPI00071F9E53|nr:hypothetical protein [Chryseobacterium sp. IHB B 17019]ALR31286.1 hypothetical protein ATE47_12465 [Chryseobacterium sp. IHB B 17019]